MKVTRYSWMFCELYFFHCLNREQEHHSFNTFINSDNGDNEHVYRLNDPFINFSYPLYYVG